jgi:hypothetical protein
VKHSTKYRKSRFAGFCILAPLPAQIQRDGLARDELIDNYGHVPLAEIAKRFNHKMIAVPVSPLLIQHSPPARTVFSIASSRNDAPRFPLTSQKCAVHSGAVQLMGMFASVQ